MASIIAGIVLAVSGHDPIATYQQIYAASFTSAGALTATFVYATPLLFTGLGVAIAFRMRVWNIGGEGQLYMGAVGASGRGPRAAAVAAAPPDRDDGARRGAGRACALGADPGPAARLPAHQRDPRLADAQLRGRPGHVLPDLRQHVLLARPDLVDARSSSRRARTCCPPPLARDRPRLVHAAVRVRAGVGARGPPAGALPPHPLRLRDARHGRLARGRELCRDAHQAHDRRGDGPVRRPGRARRRKPDRRLRSRARPARARSRPATATPGSSSRRWRCTTRWPW